MPNKHGFDELPRNGELVRRCIWCPVQAPPRDSERFMARHARQHRKDALAAAEASKREVTTSQSAIAV